MCIHGRLLLDASYGVVLYVISISADERNAGRGIHQHFSTSSLSCKSRKVTKMANEDNFVPWKEQEPLLIPHLSSATGDTIHVAAALVLYDRLDVVVVHHGTLGSCESLLEFYRGAAKSTKRVKVVYTVDEKTSFTISSALTNGQIRVESVLTNLLDGVYLPLWDPKVAAKRIEGVKAFSVCICNFGARLC